MPVHLNSIVKNKEKENNIFLGIIKKDFNNSTNVFISEDKEIIIASKDILDKNNMEIIGKEVITTKLSKDGASYEILDVDLELLNENKITLEFDSKLKESSDSNEYYNVHTVDNNVHFQIETVNRYKIEDRDIVNKRKDVYISAFPFVLSIFSTMEEVNKALGFIKPIKVKELDLDVNGYSEEFVGNGDIFGGYISSIIIGRVVSFSSVNAIIGEELVPFTLIKVKTSIGIIPVAASKDVFDLSDLEEDKLIVMIANVKADFVK